MGEAHALQPNRVRLGKQQEAGGQRRPGEVHILTIVFKRLLSWWLTLVAAGHRHFGNLYADRQSYESAIATLTRAIDCNPKNVAAYVMRGTLYWRELNQTDRAIRDLDQALALDARRWEALLNRGFAYQAAGDLQRSWEDLRRYAQGAPAGPWKVTAERLCQEIERMLRAEGASVPDGARP